MEPRCHLAPLFKGASLLARLEPISVADISGIADIHIEAWFRRVRLVVFFLTERLAGDHGIIFDIDSIELAAAPALVGAIIVRVNQRHLPIYTALWALDGYHHRLPIPLPLPLKGKGSFFSEGADAPSSFPGLGLLRWFSFFGFFNARQLPSQFFLSPGVGTAQYGHPVCFR